MDPVDPPIYYLPSTPSIACDALPFKKQWSYICSSVHAAVENKPQFMSSS